MIRYPLHEEILNCVQSTNFQGDVTREATMMCSLPMLVVCLRWGQQQSGVWQVRGGSEGVPTCQKEMTSSAESRETTELKMETTMSGRK